MDGLTAHVGHFAAMMKDDLKKKKMLQELKMVGLTAHVGQMEGLTAHVDHFAAMMKMDDKKKKMLQELQTPVDRSSPFLHLGKNHKKFVPKVYKPLTEEEKKKLKKVHGFGFIMI